MQKGLSILIFETALMGLTFFYPGSAVSEAHAQTAQVSVLNAGILGENSGEGRKRFLHDVAASHPQYVLIYFGMNDAVNEPKFLTQEQFIENIAWMVDAAREHNIVPVLSTIQHVDAERLMPRHKASAYGTEGPNGKIDRYNSALRHLALQKKVAISDFAKALDDVGGPTPSISTDGVHLTAEGYHLLASSFLRAIPGPLHSGDRVVCIGDSLTYGVPLRTPEHESDETYPAQLQREIQGSLHSASLRPR